MPIDGVERFKEDGKILPRLLREHILSVTKVLTTRDMGQIYIYDGGVYKNPAEPIIREMIQQLVPDITSHQKAEVMEQIRAATYIDRNEINTHKNLLWLENGILNLDTYEVMDFDPRLYSTIKLPVRYVAEADCPRIKEFLSQVIDEKDIPIVQEIFGYCLLKDYRFHKAFMFIGTGANGKSTLLELIGKLLGEENISSVSLWEISSNRFAPARLYGKLANIYADIPPTKLERTGQFKMATGQDLMPYEKKHRDATVFRNFAKLLFSANQLPETADVSEAFFRRWIIIEFPNVFMGEDANPNLLNELTTDEELSGLLNWALEGLRRLLANNDFSTSDTQLDIKRKYIMLSDSLRAFVTECYERGRVEDFISKDDLFNHYQDYCDEQALEVKSKPLVGRQLPTIMPFVRSMTRVIDNRKTRVWNGIKIREISVSTVTTVGENREKGTEDTVVDDILRERKLYKYNNKLSQHVSSVTQERNRLYELCKKFGNTLTTPTLEVTFSPQLIEKWKKDGTLAEVKPGIFNVRVGEVEKNG